MKEKWIVQSTYGGERLTDESSDSPYSVVLPENGSYPEDIICEVWGTERDDITTAQSICDAHNLAPTQGADARQVAIYQGRVVGDTRWDDLSKDAHDHMRNKPQIFETRIVYATRDAAPSLPHDAWKAPFDERHEFDIYPDHFMTGLRNEFSAGWHAAIKAIAAIAPREKT